MNQKSLFPGVLAILLGVIGLSTADAETSGRELTRTLGCYQCHSGASKQPEWIGELPAIEDMGVRYKPAYVEAYLAQPKAVRPHLSGARMPTFPMTSVERRAVVDALGAVSPKARPAALAAVIKEPAYGDAAAIENGRTLYTEVYKCNACHGVDGKGAKIGPDLAGLNGRLQARWVHDFLVDPSRFVPSGRMPPALFKKDKGGKYVAMMPGRDAKTDAANLVAYLYGKSSLPGTVPTKDPNKDVSKGEALIEAFGCAGCHGPKAARLSKAPAFEVIGKRLTLSYLQRYLETPRAVRPFGVRPGDGGRMPNFRLSKPEVEVLSNWIKKQASGHTLPNKAPASVKLSKYRANKAERFIREKLDCLGCHSLAGEGGKIAPELRGVGSRLEPDYLYSMLTDPQAASPGSVMPKPRFRPTAAVKALVYHWLLSLKEEAKEGSYLSPLTHAPILNVDGGEGDRLYGQYCAMCHGTDGKGAGFNAAYMKPRPTDHSDAVSMSRRPDDTLFDGIHVGGFVLNRSHRMPGWGATLSTKQVRILVKHIRHLCDCEQPTWAGDGR